jgi:hypothetical protein
VSGSIPIFLSFFLMWVFQWFLISLSVRPGKCDAILDHLTILFFDLSFFFANSFLI